MFHVLLDINAKAVIRYLFCFQMGDRVGPVGTGETEPSGPASPSLVNFSMNQGRQEALVSSEPSFCFS